MFTRLLIFLYTYEYPGAESRTQLESTTHQLGNSVDEEITGELVIHSSMYGLGDRYGIPILKALSRDKYTKALSMEYSVVDLAESITIAYTTASDDGLRKYAVYEARLRTELFTTQPAFQELLRSTPEFAVDFGTKYARMTSLRMSKVRSVQRPLLDQRLQMWSQWNVRSDRPLPLSIGKFTLLLCVPIL